MSLKIGSVEIQNKVFLAPMAGVSNKVFRKIAKKYGAGLCFSEMVSDKGLFYNNTKTKLLLHNDKDSHPYAQQIFGSNIDDLVFAAKYVNDKTDADIIDLNMGCPVPKVAKKSQAGAFLLKDPEKIYQIVKAVKQVISKPLTVKIRSGWDKNSINAVLVAQKAEAAGADAIIIHGRTRSQMYSGAVDLDIIKKVKEVVSIPVIGNGDIIDGPSAKMMLDYTNVDAIMVGRKALGNPFIFAEINAYLNKKEYKKPSVSEVIEVLTFHYDELIKYKGEKIATLEMRSHGPWYFKGLQKSKTARIKLAKLESKKHFDQIINIYLRDLELTVL